MGSRKTVSIGGLTIGGNSPVRVESMLKTPLTDIDGCIKEADTLFKDGCELVRVSFPDLSVAPHFKRLIESVPIKIMADIHFNHIFALSALESGCKAIRINPGNMSDKEGLRKVIKSAEENGAVIRIGANGGSLNNAQLASASGDRALALVQAVEEQIHLLHEENFNNMIISAKSSSVTETLRANSILAQKYDNPIHIGITEAGSSISGIVKGAVGIGAMLQQGIGDTIRVSLTAPGTEEVQAGYSILRALDIRRHGYNLISCPTCGRKRVDVAGLTKLVTEQLPENIRDGLTVAVMGCEVNGPKEAANADLGIAGTPDGFVMFSRGRHICSGKLEDLGGELKKIINNI